MTPLYTAARLAFAISLIFSVATTSSARKLEADELSAVSQIASALSGAQLCNFEADQDAMGRFLAKKTDDSRTYDSQSVAQAMFFVVGVREMLVEFKGVKSMNKSDFRKFCAEYLDSFGPSGSVIPGALKP